MQCADPCRLGHRLEKPANSAFQQACHMSVVARLTATITVAWTATLSISMLGAIRAGAQMLQSKSKKQDTQRSTRTKPVWRGDQSIQEFATFIIVLQVWWHGVLCVYGCGSWWMSLPRAVKFGCTTCDLKLYKEFASSGITVQPFAVQFWISIKMPLLAPEEDGVVCHISHEACEVPASVR